MSARRDDRVSLSRRRVVTVSRYSLICTGCGGTDFRLVYNDEPERMPMFSIGTICSRCGRKSIMVWRVTPAPETAGGLEWR